MSVKIEYFYSFFSPVFICFYPLGIRDRSEGVYYPEGKDIEVGFIRIEKYIRNE